MIILAVSLWLIRVPFAKLLEPALGANAIWWSFALGTGASLVLTVGYYLKGDWKRSRMLPTQSEPVGQAADVGMATPAMDVPAEDEEAAEAMERERRSAAGAAE
jgi:hypothetical protein